MKLLFGALSWFFIGIAYVLAMTAGYVWKTNAQTLPSWTAFSFKQAVDTGSVLSAQQEGSVGTAVGLMGAAKPYTGVEVGDARPQLVASFLQRHNSPMTPYYEYGVFFVDLADRYGFDFRLLPAISMQESGLCKSIPEGSFNCLGLGVHERGTWEFSSYRENFEAAAKILKKNYIDIGLTTPVEIMRKYTPSSDGSWANSVNQWMAEMRYNDRSLGRELKTNASVLEFAQPTPSPETIPASGAGEPSPE